jgi:hypothetical protein
LMQWAGHVALTDEMTNILQFQLEHLNGRGHLGKSDIDKIEDSIIMNLK